MIIDSWTFDVGTTEDHVEAIASRVEQSWDSGADIVLFPEYCWAALPAAKGLQTSPPVSPLRGLAQHFWTGIMPSLQRRLNRPDKLAVLGTAPYFDEGTRTLRNRAPILTKGKLLAQDKLFLTPWESAFAGGEALRLFEFKGLIMAVVICLDIEMPELCVMLRGRGVNLVLVPSATETSRGCERVTRCASARSVELGCGVVVSPLVGQCKSDLVDENLGRLGCYLPSQWAFADDVRIHESALHTEGFHVARFTLHSDKFSLMQHTVGETNPSRIPPITRLPDVEAC
jgi:predicted amidohydrolase